MQRTASSAAASPAQRVTRARRAGGARASADGPPATDPEPRTLRLETAPERRTRLSGELAVLNEKLRGGKPAAARARVAWLQRRRRNWELTTEYVARDDQTVTLQLLEAGYAKVTEMLTREARDAPSNADLLTQLQSLEGEVARASERESRVAQNLERVRALEAGPAAAFGGAAAASAPAAAAALAAAAAAPPRKGLSPRFCDASSLDSPAASSRLAHFWHPVQFLSKLRDGEELWAFGCRWTLRAAPDAPLGWRVLDERARPLPVRVVDGMLAVWPGEQPPPAGEAGAVQAPGRLSPPPGYTVHAEIVVEDVPVEHGLLLENLLDLAHAPFTHTGTFAKGWSVPAAVHFGAAQQHGWAGLGSWLAAASGGGSRGSWNPYPIDMAFEPPCCAVSHIGLAQAGAAGSGASFVPGSRAADCPKHLHQLHVCLPSRPGRTRLLYRMALDFAGWAQLVPGMHLVWSEMAAQVLGEDLRLVEGQQARLGAGSRVWAHPVAYDACALAYRRFRNAAALPYDAQAEEEGVGREAEQDGALSR